MTDRSADTREPLRKRLSTNDEADDVIPLENGSSPINNVVSNGSHHDKQEGDDDSTIYHFSSLSNTLQGNCSQMVMCMGHWKVLLLGQVLSFLLATTGAAQATLHLNCNLSAPTFATGIMYFGLSFLLIPMYWRDVVVRNKRIGATESVMTVLDEKEEEETEECTTTTRSSPTTRQLQRQVSAPFSFCKCIPLHSPAWAYFGIALLDVEANYLTVLAFKYTTLTSVTLFDSLAIPSAMVLSRLFLKRKYVPFHLLGAAVCMTGVVVNVFTDYESDEKQAKEEAQEKADGDYDDGSDEYPHKLLGDVLAITGGLLYGANNVLQEYCVKQSGGPMEFLGMLGLFGLMISAVQVLFLEREQVADFFGQDVGDDSQETCGMAVGILLLLSYVVALGLGYVGGSTFLLISEAALLNLSLLTGDLWTVTFSIVAERIVPPPMFFVALALIVSGVFLYETAPSPIVEGDGREPTTNHPDSPERGKSRHVPDHDDNELELAFSHGELS